MPSAWTAKFYSALGLQGILAVGAEQRREGRREVIQRAVCRRNGRNAVRSYVLGRGLRHAGRQIRRDVDGELRATVRRLNSTFKPGWLEVRADGNLADPASRRSTRLLQSWKIGRAS